MDDDQHILQPLGKYQAQLPYPTNNIPWEVITNKPSIPQEAKLSYVDIVKSNEDIDSIEFR